MLNLVYSIPTSHTRQRTIRSVPYSVLFCCNSSLWSHPFLFNFFWSYFVPPFHLFFFVYFFFDFVFFFLLLNSFLFVFLSKQVSSGYRLRSRRRRLFFCTPIYTTTRIHIYNTCSLTRSRTLTAFSHTKNYLYTFSKSKSKQANRQAGKQVPIVAFVSVRVYLSVCILAMPLLVRVRIRACVRFVYMCACFSMCVCVFSLPGLVDLPEFCLCRSPSVLLSHTKPITISFSLVLLSLLTLDKLLLKFQSRPSRCLRACMCMHARMIVCVYFIYMYNTVR